MNASADIPLTITPEATAHIAELGKRAALEEMIAFLRRMRPALAAIRVELEPAYNSDEETILITAVERHGANEPEEVRRRAWWDWATMVFPRAEMADIAIVFTRPEEEI
jgi:hypothetical protein